ncbi:MAG: hypothetical protein A2Z93_01555 [Curvibacter sp. GWA2_64_110]|nr:MAG: hypothetical protein A2Z93_01555 [Curvibacter sp. GWA2_64_110]HCY15445.1 hypothetical protein [Curvibacter sp.]
MFITSDSFRSPVSAFFCEPGNTGWIAAELGLQQSWFLAYFEQAETAEGDDEFSCERTMLFTDFRSVEQLIDAGPERGIRLKSVHILTPGHVNGTDTWKMDQIRSVWLGREPHSEYIPMNVFETISGEKYSASFIGLTADELQIESLKFNFIDRPQQHFSITPIVGPRQPEYTVGQETAEISVEQSGSASDSPRRFKRETE